jgi:glycosyltransferase involved in cell wall biosynthesis
MSNSQLKIALIHDCLREYGGAERVVEAFHRIWPDAPLYTSFVDYASLGRHADRFKTWEIHESWIAKWPFIKRWISPLRFLVPTIWSGFDLSGYDIVLSSSGWFMCRGVHVQKPTIHVCYIHHPPRNLYGYATGTNFTKYPVVRWYSSFLNFFLRQYDYETAQTVDIFIANSKETARRVKKFYRRDSEVIYPPIQKMTEDRKRKIDQPSALSLPSSHYYLSVSRLSYAKRIDLLIKVANKKKLPLVIVGDGGERKHLEAMAGPTVTFAGSVSDEALNDLYTGAKALLFAALDEDFGMVPVEAMMHGIPVIGLAEGGVKETVIEGKTGIPYDTPTVESLCAAIDKFETYSKKHSWSKQCRLFARSFSEEAFAKKMKHLVMNGIAHRYEASK